MLPELVVRVGSRPNRETYVVISLGTPLVSALGRSRRLMSVVEGLTGFVPLDVVVVGSPQHSYEMVVALAVGPDHEVQIEALIAGFREGLDLTIVRQPLSLGGPGGYEAHALQFRRARKINN